jgi:hypothetical protein
MNKHLITYTYEQLKQISVMFAIACLEGYRGDFEPWMEYNIVKLKRVIV